MNGIIIYSKKDYEKNRFFVEKSIECMSLENICLELVFEEEAYGKIQIMKKPDFAIVRCINPNLSKLLELYGIATFNSAKLSECANHKFYTYLLGKKCGLNVVSTIYSKGFPDKATLLDAFVKVNSKELIVKSVAGHGGSEVFLVTQNTIDDVIHQIKEKNIENKEYVIQPRINGIARDVRVYILDNQFLQYLGHPKRITDPTFLLGEKLGRWI